MSASPQLPPPALTSLQAAVHRAQARQRASNSSSHPSSPTASTVSTSRPRHPLAHELDLHDSSPAATPTAAVPRINTSPARAHQPLPPASPAASGTSHTQHAAPPPSIPASASALASASAPDAPPKAAPTLSPVPGLSPGQLCAVVPPKSSDFKPHSPSASSDSPLYLYGGPHGMVLDSDEEDTQDDDYGRSRNCVADPIDRLTSHPPTASDSSEYSTSGHMRRTSSCISSSPTLFKVPQDYRRQSMNQRQLKEQANVGADASLRMPAKPPKSLQVVSSASALLAPVDYQHTPQSTVPTVASSSKTQTKQLLTLSILKAQQEGNVPQPVGTSAPSPDPRRREDRSSKSGMGDAEVAGKSSPSCGGSQSDPMPSQPRMLASPLSMQNLSPYYRPSSALSKRPSHLRESPRMPERTVALDTLNGLGKSRSSPALGLTVTHAPPHTPRLHHAPTTLPLRPVGNPSVPFRRRSAILSSDANDLPPPPSLAALAAAQSGTPEPVPSSSRSGDADDHRISYYEPLTESEEEGAIDEADITAAAVPMTTVPSAVTPTETRLLTPTTNARTWSHNIIINRASTATLVDRKRRSFWDMAGAARKSFVPSNRASTLVGDGESKGGGSPCMPAGPPASSPTGPPLGPPRGAGPPESGPAGGGPPLEFAHHSIFDPKLRPLWQPIIRGYVPFIALLSIIVIWGIVPIFWGSLYRLTARNLTAYVINGDPDGQIGNVIETALLDSDHKGNKARLHWTSKPRAQFPTDESIMKALKTDQSAWVAVQVMDNATEALVIAQVEGNTTWNPNAVIKIWYASARNYVAMASQIVGPTKGVLINTMDELNINITATWLGQMEALESNNTDLAAALNRGLRAPQTIGHAVDFTERDINPFDQTVTVATTFVGLIYILLLAFNITMALFGSRQPILPFLRTRHLLILRLAIPTATYFVVSLVFSMINLPFHAKFGNLGPSAAAGYFAFFSLLFTGMMVLGLCTELALELLGPKFVAFGLMFLVIINVSGAQYPIPMLNQFYRISYALPFYNLRQAFIKILYDQGTDIGIFINWVILCAWLIILVAIFPFFIRRDQRKAIAMRKAARAGGGPAGGGSPGIAASSGTPSPTAAHAAGKIDGSVDEKEVA